MTRVLIVIDGGMVTGVYADGELTVATLDYDNDDPEAAETVTVPQDNDGGDEYASMTFETPEPWDNLGPVVRGFVDEQFAEEFVTDQSRA